MSKNNDIELIIELSEHKIADPKIRKAIGDFLKYQCKKDEVVKLSISKIKGIRSLAQNGYHRLIISQIWKEFNRVYDEQISDPQRVHDNLLEIKYGKPLIKKHPVFGEYEEKWTTTKLNTLEMFEFTEFCRNWAAMYLNLITQDPPTKLQQYITKKRKQKQKQDKP